MNELNSFNNTNSSQLTPPEPFPGPILSESICIHGSSTSIPESDDPKTEGSQRTLPLPKPWHNVPQLLGILAEYVRQEIPKPIVQELKDYSQTWMTYLTEAKNGLDKFTMCFHIGTIYYHAYLFEEAKDFLYQAKELSRKVRKNKANAYGLTMTYNMIGIILIQDSKYKEAKQCLKLAQRFTKKWYGDSQRLITKFALATLYSRTKKYDLASELLKEVRRCCKKKKNYNPLLLPCCCIYQAEFLLNKDSKNLRERKKDLKEAQSYLFRALKHMHPNKTSFREGQVKCLLGHIDFLNQDKYSAQNNYEEGLRNLQEFLPKNNSLSKQFMKECQQNFNVKSEESSQVKAYNEQETQLSTVQGGAEGEEWHQVKAHHKQETKLSMVQGGAEGEEWTIYIEDSSFSSENTMTCDDMFSISSSNNEHYLSESILHYFNIKYPIEEELLYHKPVEILVLSQTKPKEAFKELKALLTEVEKLKNIYDEPKHILQYLICYIKLAMINFNLCKNKEVLKWLKRAIETKYNGQLILEIKSMVDLLEGNGNYDLEMNDDCLNCSLFVLSPPKDDFSPAAYAYILRGQYFLKHDKWKEAEKDFKTVLERSFNLSINTHLNILIFFAFVALYLKEGENQNIEEAKEWLQKVDEIIDNMEYAESHFPGMRAYYSGEMIYIEKRPKAIDETKATDEEKTYYKAALEKAKNEAKPHYEEAIKICENTLPENNDLSEEYQSRYDRLFENAD